MIYLATVIIALASCFSLNAITIDFDSDLVGAPPQGWASGVTGTGSPSWIVRPDPTVPSRLNVLKQMGTGNILWCIRENVSLLNGYIDTALIPISGQPEVGCGVVWRWKDARNYYVAYANSGKNILSLHYCIDGVLSPIQSNQVEIPADQWSTLRVEFVDNTIKIYFNSRVFIDLADNHISSPGTVGVWTRESSNCAYDDFSYGPFSNP